MYENKRKPGRPTNGEAKRINGNFTLARDVTAYLRQFPGQASRMIDAAVRGHYQLPDPEPHKHVVGLLVHNAPPGSALGPKASVRQPPPPTVPVPEPGSFFDDDFGDDA